MYFSGIFDALVYLQYTKIVDLVFLGTATVAVRMEEATHKYFMQKYFFWYFPPALSELGDIKCEIKY